MANRSYNTINELKVRPTDEEDAMDYHNWKLLVRVTRLCEVYNSKNKNELLNVSLVLIDDEGSAVHAQISKSNWQGFRAKVTDGRIHIVKNFDVLPNLESYRVVGDSKVMIKFHFSTYVRALDITETDIPLHRFEFLEFHNVSLIEYQLQCNFFLFYCSFCSDCRGQRLRVALWDQRITEYKAD